MSWRAVEKGEMFWIGIAGHDTFPVTDCDFGISHSEQDVSELNLLLILASLVHSLIQNRSWLEGLVGCSSLVWYFWLRVRGVERKSITGGYWAESLISNRSNLKKVPKSGEGRPGEDVCNSCICLDKLWCDQITTASPNGVTNAIRANSEASTTYAKAGAITCAGPI